MTSLRFQNLAENVSFHMRYCLCSLNENWGHQRPLSENGTLWSPPRLLNWPKSPHRLGLIQLMQIFQSPKNNNMRGTGVMWKIMTKIYKSIWILEIPQLVALNYSNGIVTTILQSSTSIKIQTLFIDIQQRRHEGQSKSIKICWLMLTAQKISWGSKGLSIFYHQLNQ